MYIAYVVIFPYLGLFATVLTLLWFVLYREVAAGLVLAVVLEVMVQLHHLVQVSLEEEMFLVDSKRMEDLFHLLNFVFVIQIPQFFIIYLNSV